MKDYSKELLENEEPVFYDLGIYYYPASTWYPEDHLTFSLVLKSARKYAHKEMIILNKMKDFIKETFCRNNNLEKVKNSDAIKISAENFLQYLRDNKIKVHDRNDPYAPLDKFVNLNNLSKEELINTVNIILNYHCEPKQG